jgi:hypothetical protein
MLADTCLYWLCGWAAAAVGTLLGCMLQALRQRGMHVRLVAMDELKRNVEEEPITMLCHSVRRCTHHNVLHPSQCSAIR